MASWIVHGYHDHLWLVQRSAWDRNVRLPAGGTAIASEIAVRLVDDWFPDGTDAGAGALADIAAALGGVAPWSQEDARTGQKETVREALRTGRLIASRAPLPAPPEASRDERDSEPPAPSRPDETAWIEIVLLDSADPPRPVPHTRYRIELPDGAIAEGSLDSQGRARVQGIRPGTCQVTFPDLDEAVWQRA